MYNLTNENTMHVPQQIAIKAVPVNDATTEVITLEETATEPYTVDVISNKIAIVKSSKSIAPNTICRVILLCFPRMKHAAIDIAPTTTNTTDCKNARTTPAVGYRKLYSLISVSLKGEGAEYTIKKVVLNSPIASSTTPAITKKILSI